MAGSDEQREVNINGHIWILVSPNETCSRITYPISDVILAGGEIPSWDSSN